MNIAATTKWVVAGLVLLSLAAGWRREAAALDGWRRRMAWIIAALFGIGGFASASVVGVAALFGIGGSAFRPLDWVTLTALLAPAAGFLLQFRLLEKSSLMLRFLYLARAPLIILLILAAFGPIALGPAVGLLGGILVAANFSGVTLTTMAAIAVLFACGTQIGNVRAYGWERVQDESLRVLDHEVFASGVFWTGVVAAGSLLFSVGLVSLSLSVGTIAAGIVTGTVGALLLLFLIESIAALLSDKVPGDVRWEPAIPFRSSFCLANVLDTAAARPAPAFKLRCVGSFVSRLFGNRSGYVETLPDGERRILPGHTFASIQFAITVGLFWLALYFKSRPVDPSFYTQPLSTTEAAFWAPTVTSIVLLLLLTSWALAGVAFFFDRYRTPLFTIAVAAALTSGSWSHTDYTVPTAPTAGTYSLATPGQVLKGFGERPLVVAAAGGGIQAGAWTMRVLRGLDEHLQGRLRSRVAMISSVSGASMGSLYYGAYEGESSLKKAEEQALKPSLDDVATAVIGRDIFGVVGFRRGPDRGAALESSWERRLPRAQMTDATLRRWSERARDVKLGPDPSRPFPAFLFNSTIVESGQPIAFATTQLPTAAYRARFQKEARQYPAVESANRILRLARSDAGPASDVALKVVTAARLSAAFPYVSPAATLDIPGVEPFHLVDGGYYDAYGIVALSQWVDDALEELFREGQGTLPHEVGVVIARGLASSDSPLLMRLRTDDDGNPPDPTVARHGWRWQLTAPPSAALQARSFAQWAGGVQVLRLLAEKWASRDVRIVQYVFDYPGTDRAPVCQAAPLSWKLTSPQQRCIDQAWKTFETDHTSPLWTLQ
jgi:predicted acylesterase/phospholipase RssA